MMQDKPDSDTKQPRGHSTEVRVAKKEEERDTADKGFEILLSRFGS